MCACDIEWAGGLTTEQQKKAAGPRYWRRQRLDWILNPNLIKTLNSKINWRWIIVDRVLGPGLISLAA